MTLAMFGGEAAIKGPLKVFNTVGQEEVEAAKEAILGGPMSGFLGGLDRGGPYVQRLEELWAQKFKVKHAVACNSATSGLLASVAVIGLTRDTPILTTPYTMSATAAVTRVLPYRPKFTDIDHNHFGLDGFVNSREKAVIITNLFGHPANLTEWRNQCDGVGAVMIEDNAQGILAMESNRYAGTFGHMGVFSLNIHKHIQCGEGGVIVTNNDGYAKRLRGFINHGEMQGLQAGLNLRMTEVTAAIAIAQFKKLDWIVAERVEQARKMTEAVDGIEWLTPPFEAEHCEHSYYCWAFKFDRETLGISRESFIKAMEAEGMPLVNGYVAPLYRLEAFKHYAKSCPVAEDMHDHTLGYFENCAYTLTDNQIGQFKEALKKIETNVAKIRKAA